MTGNRWQRGYANRSLTTEQRFRSYLKLCSNGCIEWSGYRENTGYGRFRVNNRNEETHRFAWELANGPIPSGMWVLHKCDNRPCCNVDHLFLGNHEDNMKDMAAKRRAAFGARNGAAKLDDAAVAEIRSSRESQRAIARRLGVCKSLVGSIRRGESWRHIGGPRKTEHRIKLTPVAAADIRSIPSAWARRHELARTHGVTERSIRNILNGRTYSVGKGSA